MKETTKRKRGRPLGMKLSDESKAKISASKTGYKHDEETKRKISETLIKHFDEVGRIKNNKINLKENKTMKNFKRLEDDKLMEQIDKMGGAIGTLLIETGGDRLFEDHWATLKEYIWDCNYLVSPTFGNQIEERVNRFCDTVIKNRGKRVELNEDEIQIKEKIIEEKENLKKRIIKKKDLNALDRFNEESLRRSKEGVDKIKDELNDLFMSPRIVGDDLIEAIRNDEEMMEMINKIK